MKRLPDLALPAYARGRLPFYQKQVDEIVGFGEQVTFANNKFGGIDKSRNKAFVQVRETLDEMCSGISRCHYCEDSVANEVEHFRPKYWYPDLTFVWSNYLYACGPCNGPKSDQFAVFLTESGGRYDLIRKQDELPERPPSGDPLLINPRIEDPLSLLFLDVQDTFNYVPAFDLSQRDRARAEYTIEVLRLNVRAYLVAGRKNAFTNFKNNLDLYVRKKAENPDSSELASIKTTIEQSHYQAVWHTIVRYHQKLNEVMGLFQKAPESLGWGS